MRPPPWKVGELARRTMLSVRALHHYDEIGLLSPSARTDSGHRLYTAEDVARLQQIVSLRQLGFSLEQMRSCLGQPGHLPLEVVHLHLARLKEQIEREQRLCARLERIATALQSAETVSAEEFIRIIEETQMIDKYYTPEQLKQLEERRAELGDDAIRQGEADWAELMAQVRAEMDRGTDPTDPTVRALAERWTALVRGFTGGDPGITDSLQRMWREETTIHGMETSPVREMGEYIQRAMAVDKSDDGRD